MTEAAPSAFARGLSWLAVALSVVLLVLGVYWYGLSIEVHHRFWADILDRVHGPMTFRFYLAAVDGAAGGDSRWHQGRAARTQIVLLVGAVGPRTHPPGGCAKVPFRRPAWCCSASAWT